MTLVVALTGGDLLLWNWSLGANHTVLALIAGLTLPPLAAASALMLVLTAGRLASRIRPPAIPPIPVRRYAVRRPRWRFTAARTRRRHARVEALRTARTRAHHIEPDERELAPAAAAATAEARPRRQDRKLAA
jgi:hypothetical protein